MTKEESEEGWALIFEGCKKFGWNLAAHTNPEGFCSGAIIGEMDYIESFIGPEIPTSEEIDGIQTTAPAGNS